MDLTGRLDWFANRYVQYGLAGEYRWLNRFMSGTFGVNEQCQVGGGSGSTLRWDHRQQFSLSTTLNFNINYASNTAVIRGNAIDPLQNTQQITSSLNYSKRFRWGTLTLGGNRRQSLTDGSVQQLLPAAHAVARADRARVRTSPGRPGSASPTTPPKNPLPARSCGGRCRAAPFDTLALDGSTRVTALSFHTPLRIGGVQLAELAAGERPTVQGPAPDAVSFLPARPVHAGSPTTSVRVQPDLL